MPVIKQTNAYEVEAGAVVLDLTDLATQAKRLAEQSRREAERVLEQAKRDAERLKVEAKEKGYADGFEAGKKDGYEEGFQTARQVVLDTFRPRIEQVAESWTNALGQWDRARQDMLLAANENVLTFAFDLAQKVVGRALAHNPALVQDQLRAALALLSQPTSVTINVHPEDEPLLEEVLPQIIKKVGGCEHARLEPDESITRGGCIVRTTGGSVDATIETQLNRIAEALLPERDNSNSHGTNKT